MTDEIKPEKPQTMDYRTFSSGTHVHYGYGYHTYETGVDSNCFVELKRNETTSERIDGGPGGRTDVRYWLKSRGSATNRDELIALFRRLAEDLENHDFGD